jgi:photosystem II stability/assembly factor-like uncharacterized protein
MLKTFGLLLLASSLAQAAAPPCAIAGASAAGGKLWLLCDRGSLLIGDDHGSVWRSAVVPSDAVFRAVYFLDERNGFIAGDGGLLLATNDGARTWRRIDLPLQENLTSIHFVGDRGWIAGWGGVILHTRDAGRTWVAQQSGSTHSFESVYFVDEKHGWVVGWAGAIVRTLNGGETWVKAQAGSMTWSLNSVFFRNPQEGWIVGFGGQILHTRDGGANWQEQTAPINRSLMSVAFDASGRGWIAGNSHLLYSTDAGQTWLAAEVDRTLAYGWIVAVGDRVWAVGRLGVLHHTAEAEWRPVAFQVPQSHAPSGRTDSD